MPALAAAIDPLAGQRSLLYVSLLGYILLGPLLFGLLRIRFRPGVSLAAAGVCLILPATRAFASHPLTDTWGVAMTAVSLSAAYYAVQRGGRYVLWWVLAMLAVSVTRDAVLVPICAVAGAAAFLRSRRAVIVLFSGIAASLPAFLVFGTPLIREMAYDLNHNNIPAHPTFGYVSSHYLSGLWTLIGDDLHYPSGFGNAAIIWYVVGLAVAAAVFFMVTQVRSRDPYLLLQVGGLVGAVLTVGVAVNYTDMRLELVFLPGVAAGLCVAIDELNRRRSPTSLWEAVRLRGDSPKAQAGHAISQADEGKGA